MFLNPDFSLTVLVFSGCYKITTVFSHAQTVVLCVGCSTVLCQPTGGKARLTEGKYLIESFLLLIKRCRQLKIQAKIKS